MNIIRIKILQKVYRKILPYFLSVLFLSIPHVALPQDDNLVSRASKLIYSNPDEAIKIGIHILRTTEDIEEKILSNLIVANSYLIKGDYNNSIAYIFDPLNDNPDIEIKTQIEVNLLRAQLLRILYLDKQSKEFLLKSHELVSGLKAKESKDSLQLVIEFEKIQTHLDRRENDDAITSIENIQKKFKDYLASNQSKKGELFLAKEKAYNDLGKYDSANVYMNKSLALLDTSQVENLYNKAQILMELGHLNLQKKVFDQSEENLSSALKYAETIDNVIFKMKINNDLAINYLASNQKNKHKIFNDEFLVLSNKVETIEQEAINTLYNKLSEQEDIELRSQEENYKDYLKISMIIGLLILTIGVFFVLKSEGRKKRLKEIIKYLEISKNSLIQAKPIKKNIVKRISIPEETENNLLAKLKKFEESKKYLNKDMSLAVLAGQFETNTKYLSEIINKHYDDNFNTFINRLRIGYIMDKLKNEPNYINYKISFLAEECGYSSHSSFATVFKSIVGISPVVFINLVKEEQDKFKESIES